jgi:hypothetical protein
LTGMEHDAAGEVLAQFVAQPQQPYPAASGPTSRPGRRTDARK